MTSKAPPLACRDVTLGLRVTSTNRVRDALLAFIGSNGGNLRSLGRAADWVSERDGFIVGETDTDVGGGEGSFL